MFFQCGLGHMMGLDVHDMEGLGEQYVGYDASVQRSTQFGLKSLRMARPLEPGMVMTVEPGIYMIPVLMDRWRAEGKFAEFLNYDAIEQLPGLRRDSRRGRRGGDRGRQSDPRPADPDRDGRGRGAGTPVAPDSASPERGRGVPAD